MYITVNDLRAQGVPDSISDVRLVDMIALAQKYIERITGFFFEKREDQTYLLDGTGTPVLELPAPCLTLDSVKIDGEAMALVDIANYNRDIEEEQWYPRLVWKSGLGGRLDRAGLRQGRQWQRVWPRVEQSIEIKGDFGFLEDGDTPLPIQRACLLLVVNEMNNVGDLSAGDRRRSFMVQSESFGNYSYTLSALSGGAEARVTGDPQIDGILALYTRRRVAAVG